MREKFLIPVLVSFLAVSVFINLTDRANAQNTRAIEMTGDSKATWILTDADELIYCWWPESPDRRDQQARCRVLNKWRVDRVQ